MTPYGKVIFGELIIILVSKAVAIQRLDSHSSSVKPIHVSKFASLDMIPDLERLAATDVELANQLNELVRRVVTNVTETTKANPSLEASDIVLRYLEDFKDANGVEAVDSVEPNEVIENPISVYRLVRRWHFIVKNFSPMAHEDGKYRDIAHPPPDLIPEELDFQESINMILVIQLMYNFNVTQFADGNILGLVMKPKLRGVHCGEIGARALEREMYVEAVEWFQEARRLAETDGTISIDAVNEKIAESSKAHDKAWEEENNSGTFGENNVNLYLDPLRVVPAEENTKMRDQLYNATKGSNIWNLLVNSWGLCAGENLQSPAVKSHLFCWREFQIHPVFIIGPLNMEFLNRDPDIVQIYNALFAADMKRIMESHTIKLATSNLAERHLPHALSFEIARKFGRMVGLNATGSAGMNEPMGRMSSGPGRGPDEGHGSVDTWSYHVDKSKTGNYDDHFATVLAYVSEKVTRFCYDAPTTVFIYTYSSVRLQLSMVQQGGYTAFPLLLTAAEPISGSAIFYFNVLADGNLDNSMIHFGCPVAVGQKWSTSFRYHSGISRLVVAAAHVYNPFAFVSVVPHRIPLQDQLLKKPCPLQPKQRYQFPVNGQFLPMPEERS